MSSEDDLVVIDAHTLAVLVGGTICMYRELSDVIIPDADSEDVPGLEEDHRRYLKAALQGQKILADYMVESSRRVIESSEGE